MSTSTSWEQVRDESLAAMSETERAEHDAASIEAEARLQLAELVYNARATAGLSQTELARRAGTRQSVSSAIENGAQAPGGLIRRPDLVKLNVRVTRGLRRARDIQIRQCWWRCGPGSIDSRVLRIVRARPDTRPAFWLRFGRAVC